MGSIHEVMEAFRQAPSNSERGTKFEKLMVRYFDLDPLLSQQYDEVWRWIDWPGRKGKPDTGIDLVAREHDSGEYTAIQCKFYEPTHQLRKEDIDSFFTASGKQPFTNRIIISTTDRWGKNAEDALEDQTIPVQRIGLAEIADSPIDWDIAWVDGDLQIDVSEAARHEPRQHQATAIEKVFAGFAAGNDRGKLIMACGTGKTFTALRIAERTATEKPVDEITRADVQAFVDGLTVGPWAKVSTLRLLRSILDVAHQDGRIHRNPALGVSAGRIPERERHRYLTTQEVQALAAACGDQGDIVVVLAYTGLRWSELVGLRVKDIDLVARRLYVRRAAPEVEGHIVIGPPKTRAGIRTVPLPQVVVDIFKGRITGRDPDEPAVTSPNGAMLRSNNWRRHTHWNTTREDRPGTADHSRATPHLRQPGSQVRR